MRRLCAFSTSVIFAFALMFCRPALAQGPITSPSCQRTIAPVSVPFLKARTGAVEAAANSGIVPTGFVDLSATPVVQGIDVSKYQDEADFSSAFACGARFAFVRLSAGSDPDNELVYRTHWANARSAGLLPGGYHNLSILPISSTGLRTLSAADIAVAVARLLPTAVASGQHQADIYLSRLAEVIALDPLQEGRVYRLPTALDLSADPLPTGSPEQKLAVGPLYQAMACAFIDRVEQAKGGKEPMLLYVSATTYQAYGFASATCHLDRLPVWLRYHAVDGDTFAKSHDAAVRTLCNGPLAGEHAEPAGMSDASRCVFEQYTSFGGFAVFKPGAGLDLSRYYGSDAGFKTRLVAEN